MARDRSRRTEGSLLFLTLVILASGFALAFFAKTRVGYPQDAVDLNTASAEELAVALEIDPALAELLVQRREQRGPFSQVHEPASASVFTTPDSVAKARAALRSTGLDVNTAGIREFEKALRVPHHIARRITGYRDSLPDGRFKRTEDVLRVPIVDDRTLAALGPRVVVRHPATVLWRFGLIAGLLCVLFVGSAAMLRRSGVRGDSFLLPFGFLLAGLGIMELFSIKDPLRDMPVYIHQAVGIALGLAALLAGAALPVTTRRNLRRYTYVWALAAFALFLGLLLFGSGPEGVRITLLGIQPVEIIKILLVLFVAGYLSERGDLLADALHRWRPPVLKGKFPWRRGIPVPRREDLGPIVGMYAIGLLLFLVVRDMGPALVLFAAFLGTLYLATGRSGIAWVGALMILLGGLLAYKLHVGVLPTRVDMWLSPWNNAHPNGTQLGESLWGMASGGVWGSGLGLGSPGIMPRAGSDLVFASVAEELGLVGSLFVLTLYVLIVWRGVRIALRAQNDFDRLLAAGLTALLASQTFFIIAGVTGLLPLTGITLPFVSYGSSSLVADFFILGLLRGISAPTGSVPIGAPSPLLRKTARRFVTTAAFGLLGLIGLGRLFWVQALAEDETAGHLLRTPDADRVVRAKINRRITALAQAIPRGSIYDRKGRVLASSRLAEIARSFPDAPDRARRIFRKGRYYPHGPVCAHIVGYLEPAIGGPAGIEKEFDAPLRGFTDYSELLPEYRAKDLPHVFGIGKPRAGKDVTLALDIDLQEAAYSALKQATAALTDKQTGRRKDRAAMTMLDPARGDVLVSVSLPSFDPNDLSPRKWRALLANQDRSFRLVDRARFGLYPPGSTIKVATASAGLEEGIDPLITCEHTRQDIRWTYAGSTYARRQIADDLHDPPHGRIKMARALRVSCNLYFANLGLVIGADRLYRAYADRFELAHIRPLPGFAADLPDNAYGQGTMIVTPMEMGRIASAVANQGRMMKPLYALSVRDAGGKETQSFAPSLMGRPLGELNAGRLGEMMRGVVTEGTARGVFNDIPVEVAGKTGTAQTDAGDRQPHSWFIGYTPVSRPQFAFACVIENGGYGKTGAAPAVRDVLKALFAR